MYRTLFALALAAGSTTAFACIPPPPPTKLSGESDVNYSARAKAFTDAVTDEEQRERHTRLYDRATRVSLARVITSVPMPEILGDASPAYRVDVISLAGFKGVVPRGRVVSLQDKGITTCGRYGGGSATGAKPGQYVILFEDATPDSASPNFGLLLTELREPRILKRFSDVIQQARLGN